MTSTSKNTNVIIIVYVNTELFGWKLLCILNYLVVIDCCRGVLRRHQQHPELWRGAKPVWTRRVRAADHWLSSGRKGSRHCRGQQGRDLRLLYQQGQEQPPHRALYEPRGERLQDALSYVPLPRKLLHHRLVHGMAARGLTQCVHVVLWERRTRRGQSEGKSQKNRLSWCL